MPTSQKKPSQDPRLLSLMMAAFVGPVGVWWWSRQQPQKPPAWTVVGTFLLWGGQVASNWMLFPRVGAFQKQPVFYSVMFANVMVLSWMMTLLFAPPEEQALEGSFWWGFGLNLLALQSWLMVMHPLGKYAKLTVHPPLFYVGVPLLLGVGWVATLRSALPGKRLPSLLDNKRAASALGWILFLSTAGITLAILQVAQKLIRS